MKFIPLNGGHNIGGSVSYIEVGNVRFLIDAGRTPGDVKRRIQFGTLLSRIGLGPLDRIDAVMITHSHLDHIGGLLDLLDQMPPSIPVYFHPYTGVIGNTLFRRTTGLLNSDRLRRGFQRFQECCQQNAAIAFGEPFTIGTVRVTFYDAGHIPGSACIELSGFDGTILLTGDFNHRSSKFLCGTDENPAYDALAIDLLVTEGTYAGRASQFPLGSRSPAAMVRHLTTVMDRGGFAVFPTFAMGRAQEILTLLSESLPTDFFQQYPLYCDEPIDAWSEVYEQLFPSIPIRPAGLQTISAYASPERLEREGQIVRPAIVLVSSGIVQARTSAGKWASWALEDVRNAVILTCHQLEGTFGATLDSMAQVDGYQAALNLRPEKVKLRAEVLRCQLSGHADHKGLVNMVKRTRSRQVVLVHRHNDVGAIGEFVDAAAPVPVKLPRNGEVITISYHSKQSC